MKKRKPVDKDELRPEYDVTSLRVKAFGPGRKDSSVLKMQDPIVEEVRKHRMEHTKQFNGDLKAIVDDFFKKQKESGLTYVKLRPKLIGERKKDPEKK